MRKRFFFGLTLSPLLFALSSVGALAFALSFPAWAQQQGKVPRIGYLSSVSPSTPGRGSKLFQQELRKLGYVEGKNVAFDYRYADNKHDRLPAQIRLG